MNKVHSLVSPLVIYVLFSTVTVGVTGNKKALVSYNLFSYKLALALVTALTCHCIITEVREVGLFRYFDQNKFNRKGGRAPAPDSHFKVMDTIHGTHTHTTVVN